LSNPCNSFAQKFESVLYDEEHGVREDRWITLGVDETGVPRVVAHPFEQIEEHLWRAGIISVRKATRAEENPYNQPNR
jgi:uncharacterized DUF497 family protein